MGDRRGLRGTLLLLCFPGPLALILAVVAIRDIKRHPEKHGMGRAIFGLVMGILGTLGLGFALLYWLENAWRR